MPAFATASREYATSPVQTVREDAKLASVEHQLTEHDISGLPVVDASGQPTGVITRTDLLRAGRVRVQNGHRTRALDLPDAYVRDFMHVGVRTVDAGVPVSEAARVMVKHRVHRVYVMDGGALVGVLSTKDMMRVVADARVRTALSEVMSTSLVTVRASDPVSVAVDRMAAAHVSGLVVMDDEWPIGIFSQPEAIASRSSPPSDRVEIWMDPAVLCLPSAMPLHRAAAQAIHTRARRVLVVDAKSVLGVISGLDFARAVS